MGTMTREEKEQGIDKLLVLMNDEIEDEGCTIKTATFDFSKDNSIIKLFDSADRLLEVIKVSVSRGYLEHVFMGSGDFDGLRLTEEGQGRAISVINAKKEENETISKFSIGTLNNFNGNMQIGDNNTQNIDNAVKLIIDSIDKSNGTETQKKEAKQLFFKFMEHPLTQTMISAASGIMAALI